MGSCVIFCAGEFDTLARPLSPEDYLIAADGGLLHLQRLGLEPAEILGDFDSLGYVPGGARVFPVEKDDTDAMLAVRRGLAAGFREFLIYGGLDGPRLDHTVANFQTLGFLAERGAWGCLVGRETRAAVIRNGTLEFSNPGEGTVSVFCHGGEARGVTLQGLYYPLSDGCLSPDYPLGVSNHFTGVPARIRVKQGSLLVLWSGCGLPTFVPDRT